MLNASACTGSDEMLIHLEEKCICKQSKHGTPSWNDFESENKFLTNQTKKRRSQETKGRVPRNQVNKEN